MKRPIILPTDNPIGLSDKEKLNIAVLVKRFVLTGGSERYAVEVARRMVDRGHHVELYARCAPPPLLSGITFHRVPDKFRFSSVLSAVSFAGETARMLHQGTPHDVIHSHERGYFQDILTLHTFSYKGGIRNDALVKRIFGLWLSPRSKMYLRLEKKQMRTRILAYTGEGIKADVYENYHRSNDLAPIFPGVDTRWFDPGWIAVNRQKIREREAIADHEMVVLFVGTEFRRKGLDYLIPAIEPGMRLLIVGKGERLSHYYRMVARQGTENRVHFMGLSRDIREYFAASDVVILPSLREAFGMSILEGMACGLPVVTMPNTGVGALIKDGVNGFIAPDHARLGDTLARLTDPIVRKQVGQMARKTAETRTWGHVADQYETLYYKVAREKRDVEKFGN